MRLKKKRTIHTNPSFTFSETDALASDQSLVSLELSMRDAYAYRVDLKTYQTYLNIRSMGWA
jgi:hypothetical protein